MKGLGFRSSEDDLKGTFNVKFGIYMHQMTIFKKGIR
jgi:hypothetical protein